MKLHNEKRLPKVLRFKAQNTRLNFPVASSSKRTESNFLAKFERAYFALETGMPFARGREFGLDGYGRADVVWVAWLHDVDNGDFSALSLQRNIQLTTIEAKLKDWRKGLLQAARYRHFSNRALLVLPPESARVAVRYLATFRMLNVGLWEFDPGSGRIKKHSTPRMRRPLNRKAWSKALEVITRHLGYFR